MSKENNLVAIDFETVWDKEYSLSKMSPFAYVHHKKFNAYLVSIYNGDDIEYVGAPADFDWSLVKGMTACAHNASFDKHVYLRLVEDNIIPDTLLSDWICTADMAAYLSCKRNLKTACKILLDRDVSKVARGKSKGLTVEELQDDPEMIAYAMSDAVNCYDLAVNYLHLWPEKERRISSLNREASFRGFMLDIDLVKQGIEEMEPLRDAEELRIPWAWERDEATDEILYDAEDNPIRSGTPPLSANALKKYGRELGLDVPASTAKDNPVFLDWLKVNADKIPWIDAIGKFRSLNTLTQRLYALRDGIDKNKRFIYEKKYFGATTGRFSGGSAFACGGKFNMENIPRDVMYGVNFRSLFVAKPGHTLIIADYSQIEARCLLWRVGDLEALKPCFDGASVYQAYAERIGKAPKGSDLKHDNPDLYKFVKVQVLGGGYQSGGPRFKAFANGAYGMSLTDQEAAEAIADYRSHNPKVVSYWREHHAAAAFSARRRDATHEVELMSGRSLVYWEPRYQGREITVFQERGAHRSKIYGGKLTENEMQATCRDILCDAWIALDNAGYEVLLSVHDELVVEVPTDEVPQRSEEIRKLMTQCSPWAEGLPLGVDIVVSKVYKK